MGRRKSAARLKRNRCVLVLLSLVVCSLGVTFYLMSILTTDDYRAAFTPSSSIIKVPSGVLPNFSGEYMYRMFYMDPLYFESWQHEDVTLATQCSANHLHHVIELAKRWSGPISVAVFGPNDEAAFATDAMISMQDCWPEIRRRVTFHLVYPTSHRADLSGARGKLTYRSCDHLRAMIHDYGSDDSANYKGDIPYPHNVLRNVARRGAATSHVFLIDVDVMPSLNIRDEFNAFAQRESLFDNDSKVVFVVPVFEIKKGLECPNNKNELVTACRDNTVRPFHNKTCWWCHKPEEHPKWLDIPQSPTMEISFNASWDKSWEPFYISRRDVPLFDERFKQYGFDRIQQICELHVAGYQFAVLNNAFLVHDGWKENHASDRMKETYRNWVLFHFHFQQTLLKMYDEPNSCAPIQTWIPRGSRMRSDILNKKNHLKRGLIRN